MQYLCNDGTFGALGIQEPKAYSSGNAPGVCSMLQTQLDPDRVGKPLKALDAVALNPKCKALLDLVEALAAAGASLNPPCEGLELW